MENIPHNMDNINCADCGSIVSECFCFKKLTPEEKLERKRIAARNYYKRHRESRLQYQMNYKKGNLNFQKPTDKPDSPKIVVIIKNKNPSSDCSA